LASLERALHKRQLEQQVENYRQHLEEMVAERTEQLQAASSRSRAVTNTHCKRLVRRSISATMRRPATHKCLPLLARDCSTMGWSDKQLGSLARGAYLHDIGKLGVPDGVLLKPGPLTADERKLMQQHAQMGFDLVKDIPFLLTQPKLFSRITNATTAAAIREASRRRDSSERAIFAVADTLDAITSDRPYRGALRSTQHAR